MFEKVTGHCQVRDSEVDILFVNLKKGKAKEGIKTPIRCQNSAECPKSVFCKFVNPLSNRIPVDLGDSEQKSAEAS